MIKNFLFYFMANFLSKILIFYIFLYASHIISPAEYGLVGYTMMLIALVSSFSYLGLPGLVLTNFHKLSHSAVISFKKNMYGIFILNYVAVSIIFLIICFILNKYFQKYSIDIHLLFIVCASVFVGFFMDVSLNELRLNNKIAKMSIITLLSSVFFCFFVFFVIKTSYLVLSMQTLISGIIFMIIFPTRITDIKFSDLDWSVLKISIPMMVSSITNVLILSTDKIMISYYLNISQLGVYEVSLKFGQAFDALFAKTFSIVYLPWIFSRLKIDYIRYFKFNMIFSFLLVLSMAILVISVPDTIWNLLSMFVGDDFSDSIYYSKFLIIYSILFIFITMLNTILLYHGSTKVILYAFLIIFFINAIFNFLFIPNYGIMGSIFGSYVSIFFAAIYIITIFYLKRLNYA